MKNAHVTVEKRSGYDLASAQRLNATLHAVLPESTVIPQANPYSSHSSLIPG
jgi:glucose-6-phosphate 1-dehydrogenase